MENLISYEREHLQKDSFHSQICATNDNELIYRKSYNGDWGHWDDLPEIVITDESINPIENDSNLEC